MSGAILLAVGGEAEFNYAQRREQLLNAFSSALSRALEVEEHASTMVETLQGSIDRLVELDHAMVQCLRRAAGEEE